mgnify:CR=1 FL=1
MISKNQLPKMNNILIQCGDHLENQLRILPLAKWLKERGYNPVVMVYRRYNGTEFLKNGIDVVSLDIAKRTKTAQSFKVLRSQSKLTVNDIPFDEVMDAEFNKSPYLKMPKYQARNEKRFIDTAIAISEVIEQVQPDFIFVWNGYTGIVANFLRIYCKKNEMKCSYLERGYKKDSLYIDSQGVNGFGSLSDRVRYENAGNTEVDLSKVKKVLVPLQVQTDTNIIYNSVIKSMREFVFYVRERLVDDVILYVKTHPEEVDKNLNLPLLHNVEYIDECDLSALIKSVDLVVTINSTVGMTALFEGIPVVGLGKSIFSNKNLVIDKNQFDSNIKKFNLDSDACFKEDLERGYTFSSESPSQSVESIFPQTGGVKVLKYFNNFRLSAEKYAALNRKFENALVNNSVVNGVVNVDVFLGVNDGLDLTYRNTNVELTFSWISERLPVRGTNKSRVVINKTPQKSLSRGINVAMIHTKHIGKLKSLSKYDFIVNEYFNLVLMRIVKQQKFRMFQKSFQ